MDVQLYIYDLSRGMARTMSMALVGIQIDAVYHTSICIQDIEYFFGMGVQQAPAGTTHHGQPMEKVNLGQTQLPHDVILDYIESLKAVYTAEAYDLFENNCNNFTNDLAQFLVGQGIPSYITSLPRDVLNTPFGQMLRPQIDASMRSITQAPVPATNVPKPSQDTSRQAQASSAQAKTSPSSEKKAGRHGKVYKITTAKELDDLLLTARNTSGCATIFFTSSTCPPCKLAYPTFDSLAEENPNAVFVKIDLNSASPQIAQRYQIRATPTFMTYLREDQLDTWSGADPNRLRGNVESLVRMATPTHPHASLDVPLLDKGSLRPVLYNKIPPLEKLLPLIQGVAPVGQSPSAPDQMKTFVEARVSGGGKDVKDVVPLPDLSAWAAYLATSLEESPADSLFATLDLFRCTLLDPRVLSWFINDASARPTLEAILAHVARLSDVCPYKLRLVAVQLCCTLFASSKLTPRYTKLAGQLASSSLLLPRSEQTPALRSAAGGLVFNLASVSYLFRREDSGAAARIVQEPAVNEETQIELVAALLETLSSPENSDFGTQDGSQATLTALGYLIYFADMDGDVMDLCRAMDAMGTLQKLKADGKTEEVRLEVLKILPESTTV